VSPHEYPQETLDKARAEGMADDDGPDFGSDDLPEADRTSIERMAECPGAARLIETGRIMDDSIDAQAGEEIHQAFGTATDVYVKRPLDTDDMGPAGIADAFQKRILETRPDIMPRAIEAAWHCAFPWARFLAGSYSTPGLMPKAILCYDGGEGDRSGQLSVDLKDLGVRLTSEVDFLYQTQAPAVLREIDYKSGWKNYTVDVVAQRFQFWVHAYLIFRNFPSCNVLEVSAWQTRRNKPTEPVAFLREDLMTIEARIYAGVKVWKEYRGQPVGDVPFWPEVSKCSACPAARVCPKIPTESCAADPVRFVQSLAAVEARRDAMREEAAAHVDFTGKDIILPNGDAFGRNKPTKHERRPSAVLYSLGD